MSSLVVMVTNSQGSAGLKVMIKEKKMTLFLRFYADTALILEDQNYPSHKILA